MEWTRSVVGLLLIHVLLSQCGAAHSIRQDAQALQPTAMGMHGFDSALDYSLALPRLSSGSSSM